MREGFRWEVRRDGGVYGAAGIGGLVGEKETEKWLGEDWAEQREKVKCD